MVFILGARILDQPSLGYQCKQSKRTALDRSIPENLLDCDIQRWLQPSNR